MSERLARPRPRGWWRLVSYLVAVLTPLTLTLIFRPFSRHLLVYEIGRSFALVGVMVFTLQVLLAGRIKWVERAFGFDILIRYHKYMAIFAACLLVTHPILLALGGWGWSLFDSARVPWYVWAGRFTLTVVLTNAAVSTFQTRLKFKFESWRVFHDFMGMTLVLIAFVHSWAVGRDLQNVVMRGLWIALFAFEIFFFLNHRFVRPWRLGKNPYQVTRVEPEAKGVWTLELEPTRGCRHYDYLPGQFHFLTLHRAPGLPEEEHHFTIASSPTQPGSISSSIKELGDFTRTIGATRPGDLVTVHAPFGRFSHVLHPEEKDIVFIAGGIGITPMLGMLRYMHDSKSDLDVTLLYANPSEDGIAFRTELEEIARGELPRLKLVHILSNPGQGWTGETGRIDRDKLTRYCSDRLEQKSFYIAGPPGLLEALIQMLKQMGVKDARIHLEIFSFVG